MSRIGKKPIEIPSGVSIVVDDLNRVTVSGKLGTLTKKIDNSIKIEIKEGKVFLSRSDDTDRSKSIHGLSRMLIYNMIKGVTEGFSKTLVISGVGYRVVKQGNKVMLGVGFSRPTELIEGNGITFECPDANTLVIKGISKEAVGEYSARIRSIRPVEPYHGYGIKYSDEVVKRKVGKVSVKKE